MHELQIAEQIIEIVSEEMSRRGFVKLEQIEVRIGALSGIDPGALTFSYTAAVAATALEGSHLAVTWIQPVCNCRDCGHTIEVVDLVFRCPACGSSRLDLISGQEIEIESISGEADTEDPQP